MVQLKKEIKEEKVKNNERKKRERMRIRKERKKEGKGGILKSKNRKKGKKIHIESVIHFYLSFIYLHVKVCIFMLRNDISIFLHISLR